DDAHLLDASSAEALLFAVRRLLAEPLGVVIAARAGESSALGQADLPSALLGGLDLESSTALLGSVPDGVAERLHQATGGNPLALLELRYEAAQLGPAAIDAPVPIPARIAAAFMRRA